MTVYSVTASNWNSAAFWASVSTSGPGHTLDFSALGSTYSVVFDPSTALFQISNGATTYTVTDASYSGPAQDASLGGATLLSHFSHVAGTDGTDVVDVSGDGSGRMLESGAGADSITGGSGADTILDGSGNDTIRGGEGGDTIGSWGTSAGNDLLYGEGGNDSIIGGAGADTIHGDAGNDTLSGAGGNDLLYGGDGADVFGISDDHNGDTIDGGAGGTDFDQIAFWDVTGTGGVSVTFGGTGVGTYVFAATGGSGSFTEIEALYGTQHGDMINASADAGWLMLWGGAGNDTVTGGLGSDTIFAGGDADSVIGGAGSDSLWGEAGNDTVLGGDGSDTLSGGAGADRPEGQNDADLFHIEDGYGSDTLIGGEGVSAGVDFDELYFQPLTTAVTVTYSGTGAGSATASGNTLTFSQIEAVTATGQNDSLDMTNDALGVDVSAGAGSDTIRLGTGQDTLLAEDGADRVFANDGNDFIDLGAGDDSIDYAWGLAGPFGADTVLVATGPIRWTWMR